MQFFGALAGLLALLSYPAWAEGTPASEVVEIAGLSLLLACVFGRLWSILYSGGRKSQVLVTRGPYSITRNPLYFFSTVGSVGVGLLLGSLTLGAVIGCVTFAILYATSRGEAAFLRVKFGAEYEAYSQRVPFFWPRPRLYIEALDPQFSPAALKNTFCDALYFLSVIPAVELLEYLRDRGLMPDLFRVF